MKPQPPVTRRFMRARASRVPRDALAGQAERLDRESSAMIVYVGGAAISNLALPLARATVSFFTAYRRALDSIAAMTSFDAVLLFASYNQIIGRHGIRGPTLEIGVHHGASAIGIAALRAPGASFVAIDLFEELQKNNVTRSGLGDRAIFLASMEKVHGDLSFLKVIASPSSRVTPDQLGGGFSFSHIDGGHSDVETYSDLVLCTQIAAPGGLIGLDDYFNPTFPGVSEGTVRFMNENPGKLRPLAVGYNKVLFQREPVPFDLNRAHAEQFSFVPRTNITHFGRDSFLFGAALEYWFDLGRSTPSAVPRQAEVIRAALQPRTKKLRARAGTGSTVPVLVRNESTIPFQWSDSPIGLSYHLKDARGEELSHDNARSFFTEPLLPGEERLVDLPIAIPSAPGSYELEIDLVWEGVLWFKDRGSPTTSVRLEVDA